jgi:hypothetical protein
MDLFDSIPTVPQPQEFKTNLYKHQLANIYSMEQMEITKKIENVSDDITKETTIGFLSPPTGSGKTATVIGLIVRNRMEWNMDFPFVFQTVKSDSFGRIKTYKTVRLDKINCTLVLMAPLILHQWISEFKKTSLRVGVVSTRREAQTVDPNNFDVVLVVTSMYNHFIINFRNLAWKRFVFDEPGHVRVPGMKEIQASFYWFITATPYAITYQHNKCSTSYMKQLISSSSHYEFCHVYNDLIIRNDEEFIRMSFSIPPTHNIYHECYQPLYNVVHGFVSGPIQTMIEAGNIEGAITALGGNKTSNVIELVKRKKNEELEEIESKIRIYTIRNDETRIQEWTDRKTKVNKQIEEIENRFKSLMHTECNICMSELSSPVLETNCQNLFCGSCLLTWLRTNQTCPLCRVTITSSNLVYVETEKKEDTALPRKRAKTKAETIISVLKEKKEGKFIIFSAFDDTFNQMGNILDSNEISYTQLKGSTRAKEISIEKYKEGIYQVLLLNSTSASSGLNLQETTDIIMYHNMNTDVLNQILGRANRIGRTTSLTVHYLTIQKE